MSDADARGAKAAGLSEVEAAARLAEHGPNLIAHDEGASPWVLLLAQVKSPVIGLLAVACVVSGALGELADAIAIGTIVVLNAIVGFAQEYRAERAILALRAMTAPRARVLRDGRARLLPATEIVPGDVLLLEAGDVVAADGRLLEAHALASNEAALTGESLPAQKSLQPSDASTPLAERSDCVFMGTAVAHGTGRARVTATGMGTELGRIAELLARVQQGPTPLQQQLARVGRTLAYVCLAIVGVVAALELGRGRSWLEVLLSAVSLAVAAVPEGLPAVVTIALARGVQRMAARHVLVRRLPAVETLGSASVICTDKTGTLTTGVMQVRELWGEDPARLLDAAAACCDAELGPDGRDGVGDPTELAILQAAAERGIAREAIERERPRVLVRPFDAARKRMSIARADGRLYLKGAVEVVLDACSNGKEGAAEAHAALAARGLRVLAVAVGQGDEERSLTLLGLLGIADPPRPEAIEAVADARSAGITTVMITGDHPDTALAIARELGIVLPEEDAAERVHARATPEAKLEIVRHWKARGAVVAMTGDGVNDAPALREAHIGIAMGKTGTEVTREAADMVLADDNFASIVAAVREGRGIFDNIQKTLVYLLAGNSAELAVMLLAGVIGLPLPLLPLHLLWINLVTDGLPALALALDPTDPHVLRRPPRPPGRPLLGAPQWRAVAFTGAVQTAVTLGMFAWTLRAHGLLAARSAAFAVLVFGELLRAFAARSPTQLFFEVGVLGNRLLLLVVALSMLAQLGLHALPLTQSLFRIVALSPLQAGWALLAGLAPVTAVELSKLVLRAWRGRTGSAPG